MTSSELTWINVVVSLTFILFDIGVSTVLRLGIEFSLLFASLRCVGQLALVASILVKVFKTKDPWLVSFICCAFSCLHLASMQTQAICCLLVMLNFLGTFETGTSPLVGLF